MQIHYLEAISGDRFKVAVARALAANGIASDDIDGEQHVIKALAGNLWYGYRRELSLMFFSEKKVLLLLALIEPFNTPIL